MILSQSPPSPPLDVPPEAHLVLWPALALWLVALLRIPPHDRRLPTVWHDAMLASAAVLADATVVVARLRWPGPDTDAFCLAVLWFAVLLSVTAFIVLRAPRDGRGGSATADLPEPPWWPEFERSFREYTRRGPSAPRPRVPVGTGS